MAYPQPINLEDITPGMDVQAVVTWTATGASSANRGLVTSSSADHVGFGNGLSSPTSDSTQAGTTVTYQLMSAPPATVSEPANGTILLDEAAAAWQNLSGVWCSINGDRLPWAEFLTAHPSYTVMQDTPIVPLPDPVSPYPQTIAPGDARLGMDLRVTVTYDTGEQTIIRALCPWVQDNPPPTDPTPSFLCLPGIVGSPGVADQAWVDAAAADPNLSALISNRYIVQYDPLPAGITLLVEQMQDWTADSVWDISGIPEPPDGSIVRSKNGIAWQRTGDNWSSVVGDAPRNFLSLWGAAAPFNIQEPA